MRAVSLKSGKLYVKEDAPDPVPGFGQVLVQVKACGICGSDLHFAKHGADMIELSSQVKGMPLDPSGGPGLDLDRDVYMGHEFSAEVLEVGPDTQAAAPGTLVTAIPVLLNATGIEPIVYSNTTAGGYGERMLLSAPLLAEIPNGLDFRHAALTEPMAVGPARRQQVADQAGRGRARARLRPGGAGHHRRPEAQGHRHDRRHRLLPGPPGPGHSRWAPPTSSTPPPRTPSTPGPGRARARRWSCSRPSACRGSSTACSAMRPHGTRLVVVGVCMEHDRINPFFGISKELSIQFCLGYDPMEFAGTLRSIAEGELDVAPLITGEVDLDGVAGAFEALGNPDAHCKILVVPGG